MMKISVRKGKRIYMDQIKGLDSACSHRTDDLSKKNFICEVSIHGERLQIARAAMAEILSLLGLDQTATLSYVLDQGVSYDKADKVLTENILFPRDLDGDFLPLKEQEKQFIRRVQDSAWVVRRGSH